MKVAVYHCDEGEFAHVANVECEVEDVEQALERAFSRTQNIEGSWSRGPYLLNGEANPDFHASIKRTIPLPVHRGTTYGLRSSMTGDVFQCEGDAYVVAPIGFRVVEDWVAP